MNALERNAGEYAHRGQRIGVTIPPGVTVRVGDELHITTDAPWAWRMPARVVAVHDNGVATLEPGASVRHPENWYVVDWPVLAFSGSMPLSDNITAPAFAGRTPSIDQGDLFA